ncbi:MAG: (2Fe-2S) ferredoxin domain-containing protein [Candidatus Hydrogenedentes bacterium]|nr:(2Fe-2S) ferredoxin domain-containing protein [Candidatus Hydrogenedentota bacterium]
MRVKTLSQSHVILVCNGSDCKAAGSKKLKKALQQEIRDQDLCGEVRVQCTKCMGRCGKAPNVMVYPASLWLSNVAPRDAAEVLLAIRTGRILRVA